MHIPITDKRCVRSLNQALFYQKLETKITGLGRGRSSSTCQTQMLTERHVLLGRERLCRRTWHRDTWSARILACLDLPKGVGVKDGGSLGHEHREGRQSTFFACSSGGGGRELSPTGNADG